jgi:CRISPR-associated protein Cmr1
MTALYGGGAEAGSNDAGDPFRIPGIRGQLRFWWRATIGGQYDEVSRLREAEAAIWGSTEQASRVRLRILSAVRGTERSAAGPGPDGRWQKLQPDYALFPAQEDRKRIGKVYVGGRFRMEIAAPADTLDEVDAALWAWLTFGGIGGRTRRGAGALYCQPYAYTWKPEAFKGDGTPRPWPTLKSGSAVMGSRKLSWSECWNECIALLREFRQQQRFRPRGRSRWPEPDEIRRLRDQWAPQHAPENPEHAFPRAALGLPIIFHFKTDGDPEPNTLNVIAEDGKEARMASPVILKPWATSTSEAIPLLVVLNAPGPPRRTLRQARAADIPVTRGTRPVLEELTQLAERNWAGRRLVL